MVFGINETYNFIACPKSYYITDQILILSGEDLLYMLEQPELSGNIYCSPMLDVNSMGLILDKRKSILESSGVVIQNSDKSRFSLEVPDPLGIGSRFGVPAAVSGHGIGKPSWGSGNY